MPIDDRPSTDKSDRTFTRSTFNDSAGGYQKEQPDSVTQLNENGVMHMTFDKARKFNAYESMLHTHSVHHSRTYQIHKRHLQELSGQKSYATTTRVEKKKEKDLLSSSMTNPFKGGHVRPETKPLFHGDPGPWDGTTSPFSISARKAMVAKSQTDMQGDYAPLSDYCHRPENAKQTMNPEKPFNVVFHLDNCLTLQLRAAKEQAGLMSASTEIEDPHFAALMRKRARLGRDDWIRALPDTSSKWANQVARMKTAINEEDFNEDGRLEGGPCEYTHRELATGNHLVPKFKTFFRPPNAGIGGQNIDSTYPKLLCKTENELTHAAKERIWARARLVDEAAKAHAMMKQQALMGASVRSSQQAVPRSGASREKSSGGGGGSGGGGSGGSGGGDRRRNKDGKRNKYSGKSSRGPGNGTGIQIRTSTPFNGSRPVSRMHKISVSRPGSKK